jgi:sortase A
LLPIYHGTADSVLQKGIGHLEGSSLPTGGAGTHSVVTGHTGLAHAKMFTDLHRMSEGDLFFLHILDKTLAYKVDLISVVDPDDVSLIARVPGEDYSTLLTCTPYGINSHRLLLRGRRVDYSPEMEGELIAASRGNMWQWFSEWNMIIGLAAGLSITVVIIIMYVITRRKLAKRRKYWWYEENGLS